MLICIYFFYGGEIFLQKHKTIIQLNGIKKIYRMGQEKIIALKDINLEFEANKIYCIIGTSGSGKSTLLNLLAGLEKPTSGQILFNEKIRLDKFNENKLAEFRKKYIGFVFQSYNLFPTMSALENVCMPLIFSGVKKKIRMAKAKEMLKLVGLENRLNHKPNQMSGGQQQRVSIARAFVNNPKVIFADEPTGNLDTKTTFEMMDLITGIAKENNQTLIIVTHDLEISDYANVIIHIRDGNVDKIENKK
ncbi:MAG: ABC transporter ATP-binding protein [Firmicutes bacterium]|nr:ABC transporter ATP-binding protein [Bacillota bacterium]